MLWSHPVPTGSQIALNATIYYANISSDTPLNTPVYRIRAIIDSALNQIDIVFVFGQTQQINALLEFQGGMDNTISITESDLTTIGNMRVYDTSINLVAEPGTEFMEDEYPVELDIEILFVVHVLLESGETQVTHVISSGVGHILEAGECY